MGTHRRWRRKWCSKVPIDEPSTGVTPQAGSDSGMLPADEPANVEWANPSQGSSVTFKSPREAQQFSISAWKCSGKKQGPQARRDHRSSTGEKRNKTKVQWMRGRIGGESMNHRPVERADHGRSAPDFAATHPWRASRGSLRRGPICILRPDFLCVFAATRPLKRIRPSRTDCKTLGYPITRIICRGI